jgi:Zn-dependent protease with chaperone function
MLGINSIVNFIILFILFLYPYLYFAKSEVLIPYAAVCFAVQVLLLILGMTRKGYWILSLYQSYRKPVQREIDYIKPLANEVINQHNTVYGTNYNYDDFNFYISDVQDPNAYAFSKHCIVISAGFLTFASDDEFKAVLAHEMGHLYYKDTQVLMGALWIEIPARVFNRIFTAWTMFNTAIFEQPPSAVIILGLISFVFWLLFLPIHLLSIISTRLFAMVLKLTSKRTEYRADYHAYKVGYGEHLIGFLEKIAHTLAHDSRFFADLVASHPAPMQRIGRLEGYFRNGADNVTYDRVKPIDKFLPTLAICLSFGGCILYSVSVEDNIHKVQMSKAKFATPKAAKTATKKTKNNIKPQSEAWVYIYNTTLNRKTGGYIVSYRLRNKGKMQQIEVKQMPNKYKMSLKDLQALQ